MREYGDEVKEECEECKKEEEEEKEQPGLICNRHTLKME